MPIQTIKLIPGVSSEVTATLGVAQVITSQLIRWRNSGTSGPLIEKLGGWLRFFPNSVGSAIRQLHAWEGLNSDKRLAVGAELSLDVIFNGVLSNITPRTLTTNPAVNFSTTSGDTTVTIVDAGITTSVFDSLFLSTPVSVGGIVLYGPYPVRSVISGTSYTITAASPATATVTNGGAVPVFGTTSGEPFVNVLLDDHGYTIGENFPVSVPTTVGGIVISGNYIVYAVVDADNFTIVASSTATSTTTGAENGGNARIEYFIALSPANPPAGYGTGTYGSGGYGIGVTPTPSTGNPITATNWSLDNWGEILLANPANGPIYSWSPDSGFANAALVTNAPLRNGGMFISEPAQIVIAWASSFDEVDEPLQVNWCSSGNFSDWTPTVTNQAGGFRVPTGSRIVGGLQGPQSAILLTDVGVWNMTYIGGELVYGFNNVGTNCGLVGKNAVCTVNNFVFWMGPNSFYALAGDEVTVIPCPVWDFVFQNLDLNHLDKICAGSNSGFGEVVWYFPSISGGTGEVDSYVKYNYVLGVWDVGQLQRTAWIDYNVLGQPIGGDASGYIFQHETSPDADGQAMNPSYSTGYFQVADGDELQFIDWIFPDFRNNYYADPPAATLQIQFGVANYPNDTPKVIGPYTTTPNQEYINTRFRSRFASMTVSSNDVGTFWRNGALKIRSAPAGRL